MPRRWLSMRAQKEDEKSTLPVAEGFDFAFGIKTGSALPSPTSPDSKKPFIFGDGAQSVRRKPDLTLLIERPQTSRPSSRFSGSFSGPRSGNSCIGVAFGSPLHPPQNFGLSQQDMSSPRHCFIDGPSPTRTSSLNKWKKIGGLFRPRANSDKGTSLSCQHPIESPAHKLNLPVNRTRWRNPKSPPVAQDDSHAHRVPSRYGSVKNRPRTSHGYEPPRSQDFVEILPVPSIQVKIPGSPFERYSVMFKNLNATPQLGISRRRSYAKEEIVTPSPVEREPDTISPGLRRRVTSPTTSKTNDIPLSTPKSVSSTRYSLFPATPTTSRPQSQHRSSNQPFNRPWTAPGQASPAQQNFSPPKKPRHEPSTSNPTIKAVDLEKELPCPSPNATAEIPRILSHSRNSSSGEIFFGVKSLRDSKGLHDSQYEIARPPSSEVQLARSKSNARKHAQRPSGSSSTIEKNREHSSKSTCAQIDDTIALVQSLTSAASAAANTSAKKLISTTPRKLISQHQQVTVCHSTDIADGTSDTKKIRSLRSKSEGLNIAVPSPVLESIEEASPRTIHSRHSIAFITEGPAVTGLNLIVPRARANSNDTQISKAQLRKELPLPPPPPQVVPIKDSKFIPLSKYAPRHTAEEVARQTGLRPVRPLRSNTDDSASYNGGTGVFRRQFPPGRSCTMPSLSSSVAPAEAMAQPITVTPRSSPHMGREMPMVVAYVKPAAEVSIARTVSLSRRPSAKITVSRQPSKNALKVANRSEEELAEKKVPQRMPQLLEVHSKHKPGLSQNALVELEASMPSSPCSVPGSSDFASTLDVFPTPPMVTV